MPSQAIGKCILPVPVKEGGQISYSEQDGQVSRAQTEEQKTIGEDLKVELEKLGQADTLKL